MMALPIVGKAYREFCISHKLDMGVNAGQFLLRRHIILFWMK
jgi:hypothetical protein